MYCTDAHAVGQCPASVRGKPHLSLRESRLEEADLGNREGGGRLPAWVLIGMGRVFVGEGVLVRRIPMHCRESGLAGNITLV